MGANDVYQFGERRSSIIIIESFETNVTRIIGDYVALKVGVFCVQDFC